MLYFSYGSNMSVPRLLERVPSARFIATACLEEHELRFHKKGRDGSAKCDAFETGNPGHSILGVVFDIDRTEKRALDRVEGLGVGYEEKEVLLTDHTGGAIRASTYYATSIDSALTPYQWYKHHVLTGALENGLPENYVRRIEAIASTSDPQQERHEREMAIYINR